MSLFRYNKLTIIQEAPPPVDEIKIYLITGIMKSKGKKSDKKFVFPNKMCILILLYDFLAQI